MPGKVTPRLRRGAGRLGEIQAEGYTSRENWERR